MIKLANEDEDGEKKKARKIYDLDIEEITICGSSANKKSFFIRKSDKKIFDAIAEFLGADELEKSEDFDADNESFIAGLKELSLYKDSMPEDMQEALFQVLKFTAKAREQEPPEDEEKDDDEDEKKIKKDDEDDDQDEDYPSFRLPGELIVEPIEKDDEDDADDQMNYDPTQIRLARIEKKLDKKDEPEDPWPSLNPITPGFKIAVAKSKPKKKLDPDEKDKPTRKQIADEGDEEDLKIKKKAEEDEEDQWPSMADPYEIAGKY